jgi:hypothetical protein
MSPTPRTLSRHKALTWTYAPTLNQLDAVDGFYDMCQVVPSDGPRISTGASSGPSKRYCRVFGGVSLTRQTLSSLTEAPGAGAA